MIEYILIITAVVLSIVAIVLWCIPMERRKPENETYPTEAEPVIPEEYYETPEQMKETADVIKEQVKQEVCHIIDDRFTAFTPEEIADPKVFINNLKQKVIDIQ